MLTMDVHHPDVEKFATMKHDLSRVTGANISVRLSDEFMQAVENDEEYEQRWPCDDVVAPKILRRVRARDVWNTIIDSATRTAEPGLIFWDRMCEYSPSDCYKEFENKSTNPCSEIPLGKNDSCRLISINLTGYVRNPFNPNTSQFDFDALASDVEIAVQMADNLVDIELEQVAKIMKVSEKDGTGPGSEYAMWKRFYETGERGRRVGLGTHGLADTLAQLCQQYDSRAALSTIDKIYETLKIHAYRKSIELAEERGAFPAWDAEREENNAYLNTLPDALHRENEAHGRRNIALLTNAPTGSVSIVSKVGQFDAYNVSSGIEPVFSNSYTRRKKINEGDLNTRVDFTDDTGDKWQHFEVSHSNVRCFHEHMKEDDLPKYFVTSDQIDWRQRVDVQGAIQKHIDHSISSTVNLPRNTPQEVVAQVYLDAWKAGCKGITVYVDGSRDGVLVNKKEEDGRDRKIEELVAQLKEKERLISEALVAAMDEVTVEATPAVRAPKRPKVLESRTHKIKLDFGDVKPRNAYVTVSFFPGTRNPYEILVIAPYHGLSEKDLQILELAARTTSMNLRHGLPLNFICEQLDKIGGQYIFSIPTNLARVLRQYLPAQEQEESEHEEDEELAPIVETMAPERATETLPTGGLLKCPDCGERAYRLTGIACGVCDACGHSGCS